MRTIKPPRLKDSQTTSTSHTTRTAMNDSSVQVERIKQNRHFIVAETAG
jgi:hypothetical protein